MVNYGEVKYFIFVEDHHLPHTFSFSRKHFYFCSAIFRPFNVMLLLLSYSWILSFDLSFD
jgi:hypothetical protein